MNASRNNLLAAAGLTLGGLALMWLLTEHVGNLWHRLAWFYLAMIPFALLAVRLDWKARLRFSPVQLAIGLGAACVLWLVGWIGNLLLRAFTPDLLDELGDFYQLIETLPRWQLWLLLVWIIAGEEIVFRQAVTIPLCEKWKWPGVLLAAGCFMLVHIPWAPPVLWLASLFFGAVWSAMAWKLRSFWAPFVAHLSWDVLVFLVARYE